MHRAAGKIQFAFARGRQAHAVPKNRWQHEHERQPVNPLELEEYGRADPVLLIKKEDYHGLDQGTTAR